MQFGGTGSSARDIGADAFDEYEAFVEYECGEELEYDEYELPAA